MENEFKSAYILACVEAVAAKLESDEYISCVEMGCLVPSRNAVFPFIVTTAVLTNTGNSTGKKRALFVEVTSNTPPQVTIKDEFSVDSTWKPI